MHPFPAWPSCSLGERAYLAIGEDELRVIADHLHGHGDFLGGRIEEARREILNVPSLCGLDRTGPQFLEAVQGGFFAEFLPGWQHDMGRSICRCRLRRRRRFSGT